MPATWEKLIYNKDAVRHDLATVENDFLVASGAGAFIKKTLAETKTLLGVTDAATIDPGHKHSKLWASDGSPEAVTVDAAGDVVFAGNIKAGNAAAGPYTPNLSIRDVISGDLGAVYPVGIELDKTWIHSGVAGATLIGALPTLTVGPTSTGPVAYFLGLGITAVNYGSGNVTSMENTYLVAHAGSGTVGAMTGLTMGVNINTAGTVTNARSMLVSSHVGNASVTTYYGLNIALTKAGTGTIATAYGIYIASHTLTGITAGWNIYSVGATSRNYFEGKIGIGPGTTVPRSRLEIAESASNTPAIMSHVASIGSADTPIGQHSFINISYNAAGDTIAYVQGRTGSVGRRYGEIAFGTGLDAATEKVRISYLGNLGIGVVAFGTSAVKVLGIGSGTAPSTSPVDMAQLWVADVSAVAGNAGLHLRTETGFVYGFGRNFLVGNLASGASMLGGITVASGTAPSAVVADGAQMWVEDINAAAGKAGFHMMDESGTGKIVVGGWIIKTDTGDPAQVHEGLGCINTYDNTIKVYGDDAWRTIASGW